MANELLLSSNRVYPSKLLESGYKFLHPELNQGLINLK
jgi:NAD dependent epimerase/dehydratase family enzyme